MELSGGEVAARRADLSSSVADAGEDRLSGLPDDILVLILDRIPTLEAGKTSILSRRWRRVWSLLPSLEFASSHPHRIRDALDAHGRALRALSVLIRDASPESVAAWLPVAARRLSGRLVFLNKVTRPEDESEDDEGRAERGAFQLPCFENATSVTLVLGFLALTVPPAGVFARLTKLYLRCVRFHTPCELSDAISSPRCPCLQELCVVDALGLNKLAINSESLLLLILEDLDGLRQLTIVAPALQHLTVESRALDQLIACISAPRLVWLKWRGPYDPSSVHLGEMEQVQQLEGGEFLVFGPRNLPTNLSCQRLLQYFKIVKVLVLKLFYLRELELFNYQCFMDDMTMLPYTESLDLYVIARGHAFGASLFHVLSMCSGIGKLIIRLCRPTVEEQTVCPSDCICRQQAHWKTEELLLNRLRKVEISNFGLYEHEVAFMKRLSIWAIALKNLTVTFDRRVAASMAKEFCLTLRSFFRPEICMEFYTCDGMNKVLYVPEE